jgi:L-histidine N-alpha-methyltransferase
MERVKPARQVAIDVRLGRSGAPPGMAREVRHGLTSTPKQLPSKYFYDERGSRLFERITTLPEYYLTRAEMALLAQHAPSVARTARFEELVEPGSGAPLDKIRLLLDAGLAAGTLRRYCPLDVSKDTVEASVRTLARAYPGLEIHAVVGDFEQPLARVPEGGRRLVAFLGSTIGNYPSGEAVAFLRELMRWLDVDDRFLLGTDLVKDTAVLEAAYNDAAGVTAEFNRNILLVMNRHLQGDFDPAAFEHLAFYNAAESRIESYLRSSRRQRVRLEAIALDVEFAEGELLWTEVSCKYTRSSVERMLVEAGLVLEQWFTDESQSFALSLSRRR